MGVCYGLSVFLRVFSTESAEYRKTFLHAIRTGGKEFGFRLRDTAAASLIWLLAHGCGTQTLTYINFSFSNMCKAAKVPMVLAISIGLFRAKTSFPEVGGVVSFFARLLLFGLGEKFEAPRFHPYGLALTVIHLSSSSVSTNLQQRALQTVNLNCRKVSIDLLMVIQYFLAGAVCLFAVGVTGDLRDCLRWLFFDEAGIWGPKWHILGAIGLDNLLTAIGMSWGFKLTQEFDAARANSVCATRKGITFLLSLLLFPKPFGKCHGFGILLCAAGFSLLHWGAERRKMKAKGE